MGTMASQITTLTIVYSTLFSGADKRKYQSSASLALVRRIHRGPVISPHTWPMTRKMSPFDDVIMSQIILISFHPDSPIMITRLATPGSLSCVIHYIFPTRKNSVARKTILRDIRCPTSHIAVLCVCVFSMVQFSAYVMGNDGIAGNPYGTNVLCVTAMFHEYLYIYVNIFEIICQDLSSLVAWNRWKRSQVNCLIIVSVAFHRRSAPLSTKYIYHVRKTYE